MKMTLIMDRAIKAGINDKIITASFLMAGLSSNRRIVVLVDIVGVLWWSQQGASWVGGCWVCYLPSFFHFE